jgi:nitroalkane oxidase
MAIDFEMTPRQRQLKDDAREFAREVLRPMTERADAIADPQEAFMAMKPAFEAANALGFATSFLPAEYGGGGAGATPIINHQTVGYLLTEIAARIEACRDMCWKAGHYLDRHERGGHALSGMNKTCCTDLMQRAVVDCMRIVGVNALDRRFGIEKSYRESIVFPLYDAGNLAMQQRKTWGVMADPGFTPDLFVDCEPFDFKKSMEGFGVGVEIR